jgi:hypothetical protein
MRLRAISRPWTPMIVLAGEVEEPHHADPAGP